MAEISQEAVEQTILELTKLYGQLGDDMEHQPNGHVAAVMGTVKRAKEQLSAQAQVLAGVKERLESDAMFLAILDVIDDGGATRERAQIRTRKIRDVILATLNPSEGEGQTDG